MKHNNILRKTLLAVALLLSGAGFAWADDNPINIPTAKGTYIGFGTRTDGGETATASGITTVKSCSVDYNNNKLVGTSYTIGSTKNEGQFKIAIHATEAGDYIFGFKSGNNASAATVSLSLTDDDNSDAIKWNNGGATVSIVNTGAWALVSNHIFAINDLEIGNYTLTVTISVNDSGWAGNYGNFYFRKVTDYTWASGDVLFMGDATFSNVKWNSDNVVNYINNNGYIDDIYAFVSAENNYHIDFTIAAYQSVETNVKMTITDVATSNVEVNQETLNVTGNGSMQYRLTDKLTAGLKKIRFDFDHDGTKTHVFNFSGIYASTYASLPIMSSGGSTSYLDFSQGNLTTSSTPRYGEDSDNYKVSFVKKNVFADNYYICIDSDEEAYYNMHVNIPWYSKGGDLKVTVTDVKTSTNEIDGQTIAVSSTGDIVMKLTGAISGGVKKIRFDFINDGAGDDDYLFNIKDVTFYKRSLNENYDYTAVAATGVDVVLTRSIKANSWNTIVLPFAMTEAQIEAAFGDDAQVAQLTSFSGNTLHFTTVTVMNANEPYMIKVGTAFSNATINDVTIEEGTPSKTNVDGIDFVGTYAAKINIPYSNESNTYYFISSNMLYSTASSGTPNTMKGTRAYFKIPVATGSAKAISYDFDNSGETTGISNLNDKLNTQHPTPDTQRYNLSGQRVGENYKGIVIMNGKKYVVK